MSYSKLMLGKGPKKKTADGVTLATPVARPPRLMREKIEAVVGTVMRRDHPFRRIKLSPLEQVRAAELLNAMMDAHPSVHDQMIHPANGQFDGNPAEAARSFVRSFAARHRIPGVDYDRSYYK